MAHGWWPYGHGGLLPARSRSSRLPKAYGGQVALRAKALPPWRPVLRSSGAAAAEGGSPLLPARSRSFASAKAGRRAKGGRATGRSAKAGRPQHPASGFQIPWTPISGSTGRPWWGSKRPFGLCGSRVWFTWQRPGTFCLAQDPFIRAWHGPCEKIAGDPGGLVGPPPPLRHQPRPPGFPFLDRPQARYKGLYAVQALFLPGLQGLGRGRRGGRETRPRPAVSRTWISPGRPYPLRSGRRSLADPSGRPANSQFGSQIGNALANWSPASVPGDDDSGPLVL